MTDGNALLFSAVPAGGLFRRFAGGVPQVKLDAPVVDGSGNGFQAVRLTDGGHDAPQIPAGEVVLYFPTGQVSS